MRYHMRCRNKTKCGRRRVLPRNPDRYVREPKCLFCGGELRIDKWMMYRDTSTQGMGCKCDGYTFMHRKGSLYCEYRKDGTKRVCGDLDYRDRYEDWHDEQQSRPDNFYEFEVQPCDSSWAS